MQQQLSTTAMLQATHQALVHRVHNANDLQQQQQQQYYPSPAPPPPQQQQQCYQAPPSPQQQQQQQLSPLRSSSRGLLTPIGPGLGPGSGPGSPYRCDSPASPLAEVSMADIVGQGMTNASQAGVSRQQAARTSQQQQQQNEGPQLQLKAEPDREPAGLPSNRFYGRLGVRGSTDKERYLAPTGYL